MKKVILLMLLLQIVLLVRAQQKQTPNSLTQEEIKQGWQLLFDGKSLKEWKGYNQDQVFTCWTPVNGELVCAGEGGSVTAGDIITREMFDNFEFSIEWNISKAGNSGIFYHVQEGEGYHAAYETGPEYQLIDDGGWPDKLEDWQQTGADYGMKAARKDKLLFAAGEWNQTRIIFNKGNVEYWLNGMKVVDFQKNSDEWKQNRATGKWKDFPGYAIADNGHIGLQNHGSGVKFRNIKVRRLK